MTINNINLNEEAIARKVEQLLIEYNAKIYNYLNIVITGKPFSGKSSFLNALFDYPKKEPKFKIGTGYGIKQDVYFQRIGEHIQVWDTPILQNLDVPNFIKAQENFQKSIDIGIIVVQGYPDQQQIENYNLLKKRAEHIFIILNKIDQYSKVNLQVIKHQWREALNLKVYMSIHEVCCLGYDPQNKLLDPITGEKKEIIVDEYGIPQTLKGITEVKNQIFEACFKVGKVAFLARELKQKQPHAMGIIAAACVTSVGSIFLPGSIAIIGASQVSAISSLGYLYRGEFPCKKEITQAMNTFSTTSSSSIGAIAYGIFVSFLPPTGVFDIAGIIIVVSYMATTLLIIDYFLSKGLKVDSSLKLTQEFNRINRRLNISIANAEIREISQMNFWIELLSQITINLGCNF
ncbi:MAG: 50S ribosome-binding GTPase [Desmonostoc vinosum HA7617-LM4]|nr:50S ribosome-binding GTPase [Desmonostoc vinosum HA7617-LM4]